MSFKCSSKTVAVMLNTIDHWRFILFLKNTNFVSVVLNGCPFARLGVEARILDFINFECYLPTHICRVNSLVHYICDQSSTDLVGNGTCRADYTWARSCTPAGEGTKLFIFQTKFHFLWLKTLQIPKSNNLCEVFQSIFIFLNSEEIK